MYLFLIAYSNAWLNCSYNFFIVELLYSLLSFRKYWILSAVISLTFIFPILLSCIFSIVLVILLYCPSFILLELYFLSLINSIIWIKGIPFSLIKSASFISILKSSSFSDTSFLVAPYTLFLIFSPSIVLVNWPIHCFLASE